MQLTLGPTQVLANNSLKVHWWSYHCHPCTPIATATATANATSMCCCPHFSTGAKYRKSISKFHKINKYMQISNSHIRPKKFKIGKKFGGKNGIFASCRFACCNRDNHSEVVVAHDQSSYGSRYLGYQHCGGHQALCVCLLAEDVTNSSLRMGWLTVIVL